MSAFELTLFALNLLIAVIYAAILWVMVQQRRIMDEQLKAMKVDIFGNRFWTLYDIVTQAQTFGEGEPPHLKG